MYLIKTIKGTIRLMSDNEMYMEDIDLSIMRVFKFLNGSQKNDLYDSWKTKITNKQVDKIKGL